jgi:hypothetical protein
MGLEGANQLGVQHLLHGFSRPSLPHPPPRMAENLAGRHTHPHPRSRFHRPTPMLHKAPTPAAPNTLLTLGSQTYVCTSLDTSMRLGARRLSRVNPPHLFRCYSIDIHIKPRNPINFVVRYDNRAATRRRIWPGIKTCRNGLCECSCPATRLGANHCRSFRPQLTGRCRAIQT